MAKIRHSEEFVTYRIETDSMGRFSGGSKKREIADLVERVSDDVIHAEASFSESVERPNGYYDVFVTFYAALSPVQQREVLRKVVELLRKQGMIEGSVEQDLRRL